MGLFDRMKKGGAAAGSSAGKPTTSSVATRAVTVGCLRLLAAQQPKTVGCTPACCCGSATPQKDPMTQQEVEELVLKLNKIEVRGLGWTAGAHTR
jgi:hypothetical protein